MSRDLSSNAAKANAMKTYDTNKANAATSNTPGPAAGGANNGYGAYGAGSNAPAQPIQAAPAPVVINNYPVSPANSGGLFGGGSGPGFFTGLLAGNLLSSHRSEPRYRPNESGERGSQYEGQMPGSGTQDGANQSPKNSSFSFLKWLLILAAVGAVVAGAVWFVRRSKENSPPQFKRYDL